MQGGGLEVWMVLNGPELGSLLVTPTGGSMPQLNSGLKKPGPADNGCVRSSRKAEMVLLN